MSKFIRFTPFSTLMISLLMAATASAADNLVQVFDQAGQKDDSTVDWNQLGDDQTLLTAGFNVISNKGLSVGVALSGPGSVVSVVCKDAPPLAKNCSWTGTGFSNGDKALWASDTANGGNGPVTLSFTTPVTGVGALVQTDLPGQFTASLQVFNGATAIGTFTALSDIAGDATYIGVNDLTGTNITSVVFSLASPCNGNCADFAIDKIHLNATAVLVSLSSSGLTFAPQLLGTTSATQTVTLTNSGNLPLAITSVTVDHPDFTQTNTCGSSVAAGATCVFTVTYAPTKIGLQKGVVHIKDNSQDGEHTISVTGTGTEGQVSPTSLNFGDVVTNASLPDTVKNVGSTTMHISSIGISGPQASDFSEVDNCNGKVDAGSSCTVIVTYNPVNLGMGTAVLSISDDGGKGTPELVSLSGNSVNSN